MLFIPWRKLQQVTFLKPVTCYQNKRRHIPSRTTLLSHHKEDTEVFVLWNLFLRQDVKKWDAKVLAADLVFPFLCLYVQCPCTYAWMYVVCTYACEGVSYLNKIICSLCHERIRFRVQEIRLETGKDKRKIHSPVCFYRIATMLQCDYRTVFL